ncbi:hypothetical protein MTR_7g028230 [Medicago truncatula]|uniref:Uncharacterized protein n=1 Tax=Medicago truncatula TaxID=3880 RepID=G7L288_MEDTR|nr:hypothetical protein MTR_7g028230 [Medicago truncatula]
MVAIENEVQVRKVAPGQAISLPKSEIYYSSAVEQHMHALSCKSLVEIKATFGYMNDRIWHKINSWSNKWLSKEGRENKNIMNGFWWGNGGAATGKIQTDVDSLVTRLFKAKYFAHTDFFGSNIGTNTSYVWGSIFSAKNVVNHGARWCIGTSARIPLMGHPWLLNGECITTS